MVALAMAAVPIEVASADAPPGELDRDLDTLFARGGLTAETAAHRAAKTAPAIARKAASVDAASAELVRSKLSLLPIISVKAGYTRLSPLDSVVIPLGMQMFVIPFLDNVYDASGQITVNVSDYLSRAPALVDSASLARDSALFDKRSRSATVGQEARELYYSNGSVRPCRCWSRSASSHRSSRR